MHQPVASNDAFNADNEPLDDEDAYIESVADPIVQQQLRWQKYLTRLSEGAWGDHIALAAICNLFNMKVKVFHSYPNGADVTTISDEINIGHIMPFHFVGLDERMPTPSAESQSSDQSGDIVDSGNEELDDATIAEGDDHRLEITGGTHASMLTLENPDQIVSIAPS